MYPAPNEIFKVFQLVRPQDVRVVIIGQDPYPSDHADGLAFSSKKKDTPYSLQRIFREVDRDIVKTVDKAGFASCFASNSLIPWASQGVLLLNTVMTVRANAPGSHRNIGWEQFTSKVIDILNQDVNTQKVFVAWGSEAQKLIANVTYWPKFETGHPASAAHGKDMFSGCSHFSKINRHLHKIGLTPINWKT